ncbi:Nucleotide-binding universal stress protein, UspA family [Haloarcula vallismortis]|uniref:Universal stress protein n=2 Tax=Haloarcula vallismortis TaxID=28442 RepID=M0IW68_HALVA|nr:universal stress protein [Haloarcula vallismortis]EMA01092.1 universal stress protein [Haloarcula vallismortis ATCC 29715]SDW15044.1 Nucleotide-binding universal stress protein, UspA family [Haloarcula vallismortis]
MYDRILVPTDGSPGSRDVITHAKELAVAHESEIHALYVVDTGRFSTLPHEPTWESVTDSLHREGEMALDTVERLIGDDMTVTRATAEGSPSRKIVDYASQHGCDLIVMGTHGRGGIDRLLLGSVAERVVRSAHIPVVTVPVETTLQDVSEDEQPAGVPQ